jgi:hypothetical protein
MIACTWSHDHAMKAMQVYVAVLLDSMQQLLLQLLLQQLLLRA